MFIIMSYERLGRSIDVVAVREKARRPRELLAPEDVGRVGVVGYRPLRMTSTK